MFRFPRCFVSRICIAEVVVGRVCIAEMEGRVCIAEVVGRVCIAEVVGRMCLVEVVGRVCIAKLVGQAGEMMLELGGIDPSMGRGGSPAFFTRRRV